MQTTYGPFGGSGVPDAGSDSDSATSAAESANSVGPTSDLANLSVEVVERILTFLPGNDIVVCKRVSRWFREIVDGSVLLQYIVECHLSGVVDNPARPETTHERLKTIRKWRAAVQHPQWTATSQRVQSHPRPIVHVFGSAYVLQAEGKITIIQPQSEVKGRVEERWVVDIKGLNYRQAALAYDHNEKVLALIEYIEDGDDVVRIHMFSVSGAPHPLAQSPVKTIRLPIPLRERHSIDMEIKVHRSKALFAIGARSRHTIQFAHVWDWQSGDTYTPIEGVVMGVGSSFLTPHYTLSGTMSSKRGGPPDGLLVCKLEGVSTPENSLRRSPPIVLALPKLEKGARYYHPVTSCHHLSSQANNDVFYRSAGHAMVRIWTTIEVFSESFNLLGLHICAPVDAVLALVESVLEGENGPTMPENGVTVVPWSRWGYHTRIMEFGSANASIQAMGPSTSTFYFADLNRTFYHEFNAADSIKADSNSPQFISPPRSSLTVEPSQCWLPGVLNPDDTCTSLPYRTHILDLEGAPKAQLGEDFLVTSTTYEDDGTGYTHVRAYTI